MSITSEKWKEEARIFSSEKFNCALTSSGDAARERTHRLHLTICAFDGHPTVTLAVGLSLFHFNDFSMSHIAK